MGDDRVPGSMIVGTAGHVDHGKSTLVRALTGTEPDRWEEERRRGLSIGLGYGSAHLPGGHVVSVIDVPGHGRFLPTMMQGAHAVDVAVVVVAAHEGWMPQTEEHLNVLEALGTAEGIVVLTHPDRVAPGELAEVAESVRLRLRGTFLDHLAGRDSAPVTFDGSTGAGLGAVRERLADAVATARAHRGQLRSTDRPRMWVDRTFVLAGAGRICTGTLTGGALRVGDRLSLLRGGAEDGAAATDVGIASLQVHGTSTAEAAAGSRVGLRLGSTRTVPEVGDALVRREQWCEGRHLHAALLPLRGHRRPRQRHGYELVMGTARWPVELRRSPKAADPFATVPAGAGESAGSSRAWEPVRLHCGVVVAPAAPGDRFVLVDSTTARPVAAGVLLAVDREVVRRRGEELQELYTAIGTGDPMALAAVEVRRGGDRLAVRELTSTTGISADAAARLGLTVAGGEVVAAAGVDSAKRGLLAALRSSTSGRVPLGDDPVRRHAAAQLVGDGLVTLADGYVGAAGGVDRGSVLEGLMGDRLWTRAQLVERLAGSGEAPELLDEALRDGRVRRLVRRATRAGTGRESSRGRSGDSERLVSLASLHAHAESVSRLLSQSPATLPQLRDALGLSRADALAVLEHFDEVGITARDGSVRKAGPQAR